MSAWAKPGVKCVCIRGGSPNCFGFREVGSYPVEGAIYTIRGVYHGPQWDQFYLVELPSGKAKHPDGCEMGWNASHFRPLVTRIQSEDVALFRKLLVTEGEDA
jgi:hypothetical protein